MSEPPGGTRESGGTASWLPDTIDSGRALTSVERLASVGVWAYDPATGEIRWSDTAKQLYGVDPDEGATLEDVLERHANEDRVRLRALFERALEEGEAFDTITSFLGDSTTERAIRVSCETRADGETVHSLCGIVEDVTDTRRREQRIQVLRDTSQQLKQVHTGDEVAEILANAATNILGLVNTAVRLVDERNRLLTTACVTEECIERAGERPDYPVDGDSAAARVFRTGEPRQFADMRPVDDWDRGELVSGLYVPIGKHGVLSAGDIVTDAFRQVDLEAAALLGEVGAETLTRIGWARRSRAV